MNDWPGTLSAEELAECSTQKQIDKIKAPVICRCNSCVLKRNNILEITIRDVADQLWGPYR